MKRDQVFNHKQEIVKPFEFNEAVAEVFDDMVARSVPFYHEIHRIILDIIDRFYHSDRSGPIYDLGCSTGTTISLLFNHFKAKEIFPRFIGIDNSSSMLKKCQEKLSAEKIDDTELICADLEEVALEKSGLIIMNYTLQFIPLARRVPLLHKIYKALNSGGIFIFSEKIISDQESINKMLTELYYDFKRRNGYSELEIAQKREALEDVLVPLTPEKQLSILREAGFAKCDVLFRLYNFACFIGIK